MIGSGWGHAQKLPDAAPGFVQLRLGVSHGAVQHLGNFLVVIPFDLVQQENGSATSRQIPNGPG